MQVDDTQQHEHPGGESVGANSSTNGEPAEFDGFFEGNELEDAMPEVQVSDSLQAALRQMREDVSALEGMEPAERAEAAERIAEQAARIDEQIASESRRGNG